MAGFFRRWAFPHVYANEQARKKEDTSMEEGFIGCCFSFTIGRVKWGIPSMIVGNVIKR
jgi:hypothetical protein